MPQILLSKSGEWVDVGFKLEQPYIKIISFVGLESHLAHSLTSFQFYYQYNDSNGQNNSGQLEFEQSKKPNELMVNVEVDLTQARDLKIQYVTQLGGLLNSKIQFNYEDLKWLDITNPRKEFENHLGNLRNSKILFSAPFGQGKTTFLNEYFNIQLGKKFEVFRVFPINYSVAQNEDIFRYIKADILFQLIADKNIEFEKIDANYAKTIPKFLKKDIHKVLAPFLMLIPGVGKDLFSIFEKLNGVSEKFFESHDREGKNDEEESNKFLKVISEKEGSIFEDNFITQLLRQQIKKIANSGKETVLIIDDLDRVDPEHTFRILNVISAHYDTLYNTPIYENNKFGFDKIILVCDLQNIRYTFEHRYGSKVNFTGYISKFYSTSPFQYDNKRMMLSIMNEIEDISPQFNPSNIWTRILNSVIEPLITMDVISLREMYKLKHIGIKKFYTELRSDNASATYNFNRGILTPIIKLLSQVSPLDVLLGKYNEFGEKLIRLNQGISNDLAFPMIATLATKTDNSHVFEYDFKSKGLKMTFGLESQIDFDYTTMHHIEIIGEEGEKVDINTVRIEFSDFCFLVSENIRRYMAMQR